MPVTTRLERHTHKARTEPQTRFNALMGQLFDPDGLRESYGRQDGRKAPGVDEVDKELYPHPLVEDSNWEPDGVTLQVRFCEEPGTN